MYTLYGWLSSQCQVLKAGSGLSLQLSTRQHCGAQESKHSACRTLPQTWTRFSVSPLLCAPCTRNPTIPLFVPPELWKAQVEDPCWSGPSRQVLVTYCVCRSVGRRVDQLGIQVHLLLVCCFQIFVSCNFFCFWVRCVWLITNRHSVRHVPQYVLSYTDRLLKAVAPCRYEVGISNIYDEEHCLLLLTACPWTVFWRMASIPVAMTFPLIIR